MSVPRRRSRPLLGFFHRGGATAFSNPAGLSHSLCLFLTLLGVFFGGEATAAKKLRVPKDVLRSDQIDEAVRRAASERKAVSFVVMDATATSGRGIDGTASAFRRLKPFSVIVFIDSSTDKVMRLLPPPLLTKMGKLGAFVPRLVVASPDITESWHGLGAASISGNSSRKFFQQIKDDVLVRMEKWRPAAGDGELASRLAEAKSASLWWGMDDGTYFAGEFRDVRDGKFYFVDDKDKKEKSVDAAAVAPPSLKFAEILAGGAGEVTPARGGGEGTALPGPLEAWTSRDGKTIKASFIALGDGAVTLRTAAGKEYAVPLERLDDASRELAEGRDFELQDGGGDDGG